MIQEIITEKLPIKLWLSEIEGGAMAQARNLANLPFTYMHVALMPDAHEGFGMPIGGVLATKNVIIPNAVGVDIGCGMCAVKTSLTDIDTAILRKSIMSGIREVVPLGFKHHSKKQNINLMPDAGNIPANGVVAKEFESARTQVGTLGGGNHFIEIQRGSDGYIWVMVHSGSRNLGYKVAEHYNKLAKQLNVELNSEIPVKWDLAFLPIETELAQNYINEMNYCVDFALANRKLMMDNILSVINQSVPTGISSDPMINIAHNYANLETHFGEQVYVHRKGATQAKDGQLGIIPGSQGTESYIVRGKGNPLSFESCSHGAGRVMGRKQAIRQLDLQAEIESLDKKNIIHSIRSKNDLEEAPSAYKDISVVMKNQQDLVDIVVELKPLAVVKG